MKHKLVFDVTDAGTIAESDSLGAYLRSADGTLLTHSTLGAKEALDVSIADASIEVTATDLDIRDLDASQDNVAISDGTDTLEINADGSINAVVTATDLDIRDLDAAQDSVASHTHDGAGTAITSTAGALDVNIASGSITVTEEDNYEEDSAHTSGDMGGFVLAVRQDTLASSTSDDGDYAAFKVNELGELYTKDSDVLAALEGELEVSDAALADAALLASASSVTTTSAALLASSLADRKYMMVYNNGNRTVFIGQSGVSTANGFPIFSGSMLELRLGAAVAPHAVSAAATQELRVLELS